MPYARASLAQLWDRIGAAYRARFPGADTNLRLSPDRAIVATIAAGSDEDLAYTDWQSKQLFPFSADTDYLERWAAWRGVFRLRATGGAGLVALTGTAGYTAPKGTQLQTADGITVTLQADAVLGEDGTVNAPAAVDMDPADTQGAVTNIGVAVQLTFMATPAGFADRGSVATAFAGGADAETDAALRQRTQRRYSQPSFGGNQNDWQNAVLAVPGVTRVFTSAGTPSPGAVTIWPLFDALRANGIPVGTDAWYRPSGSSAGDGDQKLVLDAVLAANARPVCASLYVRAIATQALNLTISGLDAPTDAVKAAVATEIQNMLIAKAATPVTPGIDAPASGYTIYKQWIDEAIARATGVKSSTVTVPSGNVTIAAGTLCIPGVNTYV